MCYFTDVKKLTKKSIIIILKKLIFFFGVINSMLRKSRCIMKIVIFTYEKYTYHGFFHKQMWLVHLEAHPQYKCSLGMYDLMFGCSKSKVTAWICWEKLKLK